MNLRSAFKIKFKLKGFLLILTLQFLSLSLPGQKAIVIQGPELPGSESFSKEVKTIVADLGKFESVSDITVLHSEKDEVDFTDIETQSYAKSWRMKFVEVSSLK